MKLKVKILELETGGKPIVILNKKDADKLGVKSSRRINMAHSSKEFTVTINVSKKMVKKGFIGLSDEVKEISGLKNGANVNVESAKVPKSSQFIKNRINGRRLNYKEISSIVNDVVKRNLTEVEIAAFVTALNNVTLSTDETVSLSKAMIETGETLNLGRKIVCDKHSVGGCLGDKTTLLLVPIIAAAGLAIPKTSSRAITSAAGTADKAECLMPVDLTIKEMERVVKRTNGCIVWGGSLYLAPADDIFIQVEYPLAIDPLLLPSIMSKKKSVGATHLVVDMPIGKGNKVNTIEEANLLGRDFIQLGDRLGIKTTCVMTYCDQPIGYTIGPALEAREALEVITNKRKMPDLVDKVTDVAGVLLEMTGKKNGKDLAMKILKSGEAEDKLREIISAQGGDKKIKPEDIVIGSKSYDVIADRDGYVFWSNRRDLIETIRTAGAPKDKGAGMKLYKKVGDKVEKGDKLFTIFAEKTGKLNMAVKNLDKLNLIYVGQKREMLINKLEEIRAHGKEFILER